MEQNNLVFEVDGAIYELVYNFKDAFQKEIFEEKLVDVLKNKPYIVGDISHEKYLRQYRVYFLRRLLISLQIFLFERHL